LRTEEAEVKIIPKGKASVESPVKGEKNDSEEIKLIMIPKLNYDNTLKAEFRSSVTKMIRSPNTRIPKPNMVK